MTDNYGSQTIHNADVDLTNCDKEPIHILGHVQSYGCLISTSADLMINHVSENCETLLGIQVENMVGCKLEDFLGGKIIHDLRSKLQISAATGTVARMFGRQLIEGGGNFDISIHASGASFIFEFEPKVEDLLRDDLAMVQPLIGRVAQHDKVQKATDEATRALQVLSGFDRVMVYKFADDGSGEVVSERIVGDQEPFLGLRYPASDIPKQARALYKRSPLRLIADIDDTVSPIVPQRGPTGEPLDLSLSITRAVSPIHLEYLRNMGVQASMSVSILVDGELWGLFACHHNSPRYVDYERRTAIELFAQLFSYELARKLDAELRQEESEARLLHDRLMMRLSSGEGLVENFAEIAEELSQIISNDGMAILSEGRYAVLGSVPSEEEFNRLVRFLNTVPAGQIFHTDNLQSVYQGADILADRVAGLIAIPISRTPRDYIVFFRREIAKSVTWAGNPEKPVEIGPNGVRLTPRKSFEAWSEMVRHTCQPWSGAEVRAAEALRISLIEIVLKLTDEANAQRKAAAERQELLVAELNHRVRNILNLIQGLVSQSKVGTATIEDYTSVLDGRIQSMARAHDQLTKREWGHASLRDLIEVEVDAFANNALQDRVEIAGDTPLLTPDAFSTMALVVHELVTNSAKYGALTDQSGDLRIELEIAPDGALLMRWRERGGPAVQAPTRRGFGTTIIERTIPFELRGTVETRYKLTGFEADIMIPEPFVSRGVQTPSKDVAQPDQASAPEALNVSGRALVVEDNMVIALDAADFLSGLGASDVQMASSVDEAIKIIDANDIALAILDVNLGQQTSVPVAEKLTELGVPFILATGYGDVASILDSYPSAPVVKKPYSNETLIKKLTEALNAVH
ncbi:HWE histidine kinase domain-containing protein [Pseudooctadecabacter jejudonensis]|uniref:histidine kinase n=1 Tax=Pseudooctadecabacter jejudonensis TaxID=1391910 RepID=A0A1Y5SSC1_9RHOB|nr:HWE histidine kinase domain-containing protein [Pseudooctadecabacter jejudonensis]SLN44140.1 Bacteriophytochrome [Pseudooctadecabacter jejudonensis]